MKKIILLFLLLPIISVAQIEKSLQMKIAILNSFAGKGEQGEEDYWKTKGKITFGIVNYTEEQNPKFKELFIKQYREIMPIFKKMLKSENEKDTGLFVKTIIRHEEQYRKMLTKEQLESYLNKLEDFENNNPQANDSYSALFFSKNLLKLYKTKF
jgi:hypothetical protein